MRAVQLAVAATIATIFGLGASACGVPTDVEKTDTKTSSTSKPKAAKPSNAKPKPKTYGDGQYHVGVDIKPGRYKVDNADDLCYFAVLNSTDATDIATNGTGKGSHYVTLKTGKYFETRGCPRWGYVGK